MVNTRIFRTVLLVSVIAALLSACAASTTEPEVSGSVLSAEEQRRVDLYVAVMRGAYDEENGGDRFIAIDLSTLEGLSEAGRQAVLDSFAELSDMVVSYEDIKADKGYFELGTDGSLAGMPVSAKGGSVLSITLESYKGDRAEITGTSWFGVLGAVFPVYDAEYKDGQWQLKLISMGIS